MPRKLPTYTGVILEEPLVSDVTVAQNGWIKNGTSAIGNGFTGNGSTFLSSANDDVRLGTAFSMRMQLKVTSNVGAYTGLYSNGTSTNSLDIGFDSSQFYAYNRNLGAPPIITALTGGNFFGQQGNIVWLTYVKRYDNTSSLYVNNTLIANSIPSVPLSVIATPQQIGARNNLSPIGSNITIYQVNTYGVALSVEDIAKLNAGTLNTIKWDYALNGTPATIVDGLLSIPNAGTIGGTYTMGDGTTSTTYPKIQIDGGIVTDGGDTLRKTGVDLSGYTNITVAMCVFIPYIGTGRALLDISSAINTNLTALMFAIDSAGTRYIRFYGGGTDPTNAASYTTNKNGGLYTIIGTSNGAITKIYVNGVLGSNASAPQPVAKTASQIISHFARVDYSTQPCDSGTVIYESQVADYYVTDLEAQKIHNELLLKYNI